MDLFNDDQQETRAVPPVSAEDDAKNNRRRRSDRYADISDETEQQEAPAQDEVKEAPFGISAAELPFGNEPDNPEAPQPEMDAASVNLADL